MREKRLMAEMNRRSLGIVNFFSSIDEFSPLRELFRAISSKKGVNMPEKEYRFPTLRGK
jgi:hypothetical protein